MGDKDKEEETLESTLAGNGLDQLSLPEHSRQLQYADE